MDTTFENTDNDTILFDRQVTVLKWQIFDKVVMALFMT